MSAFELHCFLLFCVRLCRMRRRTLRLRVLELQSVVCTFFRTYGSLAMNLDLSEAIGFLRKLIQTYQGPGLFSKSVPVARLRLVSDVPDNAGKVLTKMSR